MGTVPSLVKLFLIKLGVKFRKRNTCVPVLNNSVNIWQIVGAKFVTVGVEGYR